MGLIHYTIRRILQIIPVLIGIVTITFFLSNAIPGNPVEIMLGPEADPEQIRLAEQRFGLDKPLHERYINYMVGVAQGDLGASIYFGEVSVEQKIMERFPITMVLMTLSLAFALVISIPLGVISAYRRNEKVDHTSRLIALWGVSTPGFWIGLMLIIIFSFHLDLLPSSGQVLPWADPSGVENLETRLGVLRTSAEHLIMPVVTLGTFQMAATMRIERSATVSSLQSEYIRLARAYGVSERKILSKHAFRPAQLPVVTVVGLNLATLFGGSVLIETVFNINGMGRLIILAIENLDYPLLMGTTLVYGFLFMVGVLITDISYAYIDPRVSYGEGSE